MKCDYCGNNKHKTKTDCPAYRKQCHKCSKYNHFANLQSLCMKYALEEVIIWIMKVTIMMMTLWIIFLYGRSKFFSTWSSICRSYPWYPELLQENWLQDWYRLTDQLPPLFHFPNTQDTYVSMPLEPSNATLTAYSGHCLSGHGKVMLDCMHKRKAVKTDFNVVENSAPPLLSLTMSWDLGLIQMTHSVNHSVKGLDHSSNGLDIKAVLATHKDLFKGTGLLLGTCSLHLKEDALPVLCPTGSSLWSASQI